MFAANYLGAIAMPINWRLAAPEVRYILEHSGARALVCDEALVELASEATRGLEAGLVRACVSSSRDGRMDDPGRPPVTPGRGRPGCRRQRRRAPVDVHVGHDRTAQGRDDHPRQPCVEEPWPTSIEFGFTSADLGLACGPLYHVGALDLTTTSLIAAGATTIIQRSFDASDVVDEIERSRVSTVWLAPAMVNAIMALPDIEAA